MRSVTFKDDSALAHGDSPAAAQEVIPTNHHQTNASTSASATPAVMDIEMVTRSGNNDSDKKYQHRSTASAAAAAANSSNANTSSADSSKSNSFTNIFAGSATATPQTLGINVVEGHDTKNSNRKKQKQDSPATSSLLDTASIAADSTATSSIATESLDAEIHPFWLYFYDDELEDKYVDFAFGGAFAGGKMYTVAALAILIASYGLFHHAGVFAREAWVDSYWIALDVAFAANVLMLFAVFLLPPQFTTLREGSYCLTVASHWVGYTILVLAGKKGIGHDAYRYTYLIGCLYFCTFTAQPRFSRVFLLLTAIPLITMVTTVLVTPGYFDTHTELEILYWPLIALPLIAFRFFERSSRRAFLECEHARDSIEFLNDRIAVSRALVSKSLFPPTATLDFLLRDYRRTDVAAATFEEDGGEVDDDDGESAPHTDHDAARLRIPGVVPAASGTDSGGIIAQQLAPRTYTNSVVVVTDLVGFTAWSSRSTATAFVRFLNRMFAFIDDAATLSGVEKISTAGDSFIGCVVDPEILPGQRVLAAVKFGLDVQGMLEAWNKTTTATGLTNSKTSSNNAEASSGSKTKTKDKNDNDKTKQQHQHREADERHEMRIGVAIGDLTAAFIGHAPPRFDIFGHVTKESKDLEGTCIPGCVNCSGRVCELLEELGYRCKPHQLDVVANSAALKVGANSTTEEQLVNRSFSDSTMMEPNASFVGGGVAAALASSFGASRRSNGDDDEENEHNDGYYASPTEASSSGSTEVTATTRRRANSKRLQSVNVKTVEKITQNQLSVTRTNNTADPIVLPESSRFGSMSLLNEDQIKFIVQRVVSICVGGDSASSHEHNLQLIAAQAALAAVAAAASSSSNNNNDRESHQQEQQEEQKQTSAVIAMSNNNSNDNSNSGPSSETNDQDQLERQGRPSNSSNDDDEDANDVTGAAQPDNGQQPKPAEQLKNTTTTSKQENVEQQQKQEQQQRDPNQPNLEWSRFWLEFEDPVVEKLFHESLRRSNFASGPLAIMAIYQAALIAIHLMIGCLSTVGERVSLFLALVLLIVFVGHLVVYGVTEYTKWLCVVCMGTVPMMMGLTVTSECHSHGAASDLIVQSTTPAILGFVFTFDLSLIRRTIGVVLMASSLYFVSAMRHIKFENELLPNGANNASSAAIADLHRETMATQHEIVPLVAIAAYSVVSIFSDIALRTAFESKLRFHFYLKSAAGRAATVSNQMTRSILPPFVSDALGAAMDNNGNACNASDRGSLRSLRTAATGSAMSLSILSSSGGNTSSKLRKLGFKIKQTIWRFETLTVLFVFFDPATVAKSALQHQPGESLAHDDTDDNQHNSNSNSEVVAREAQKILALWEMIAARHQVQKIKSIGNMTLWVSGIELSSASAMSTNNSANNSASSSGANTPRSGGSSETLLNANNSNNNSRSPTRRRQQHQQREDSNKVASISAAHPTQYALNGVRAALQMLAAVPGDAARAGVATSPLTGALLGTDALMFDVFGSTVNLASRLSANAVRGQVLISKDTQSLVQMRLGGAMQSDTFRMRPVPPLNLKGIGLMEVAEAVPR